MEHGFTLDNLRAIMRAAAGEGDNINLDGAIADMSYADLGYDSLALLEFAAQIEHEHGVPIPDGTIGLTDTPGDTVRLVEDLLADRVRVS
jgi:minimal PKS acyl carrier protein